LKTFTKFPGAGEISLDLKEGWISQIKVRDSSLTQALSLDLDRGEAEAIALALQLGCSRILMDESDGRTRAKALGLKTHFTKIETPPFCHSERSEESPHHSIPSTYVIARFPAFSFLSSLTK